MSAIDNTTEINSEMSNNIISFPKQKKIENSEELDKKLTEEDEEWLENNINVMLSVVQCIAYRCIDEAHPLDKLVDNLASHLKETED